MAYSAPCRLVPLLLLLPHLLRKALLGHQLTLQVGKSDIALPRR